MAFLALFDPCEQFLSWFCLFFYCCEVVWRWLVSVIPLLALAKWIIVRVRSLGGAWYMLIAVSMRLDLFWLVLHRNYRFIYSSINQWTSRFLILWAEFLIIIILRQQIYGIDIRINASISVASHSASLGRRSGHLVVCLLLWKVLEAIFIFFNCSVDIMGWIDLFA